MVSQATAQEVFRQLLQDPENQLCFDCRKKGTQWASVSHGIFLCLECSGFHRGLGVHISFVRSVTMDSWSVKQLKYMSNGGNRQFREFLQPYNIPEQPLPAKYQTIAAKFYRDNLKSQVEETPFNQKKPSPEEGAKNFELGPSNSSAMNSVQKSLSSDPLPQEQNQSDNSLGS